MGNRVFWTGVLLLQALIWSSSALAQQRRIQRQALAPRSSPTLTWDLGGAAGSYNGVGYSEVNLGLNWFLQDYMIWRNSVFARFPSQGETLSGLDSSLRFRYSIATDDGGMGIGFFGGPGYRFSKSEASAAFAEAGLQIKLGGLNIGGGVKMFSYTQPGRDFQGRDLPQNETLYFLILSGGGAL